MVVLELTVFELMVVTEKVVATEIVVNLAMMLELFAEFVMLVQFELVVPSGFGDVIDVELMGGEDACVFVGA
jgi:hypothetical protein